MTIIKNLVDCIDEELEGAKHYAEKYVELKAKGDNTWANRYKTMAQDELNHADWIHELAVNKIGEISKIYTPPTAMQDKWDRSHAEYVEHAALIKQMLTL